MVLPRRCLPEGEGVTGILRLKKIISMENIIEGFCKGCQGDKLRKNISAKSEASRARLHD
jgi:hypothetical protein